MVHGVGINDMPYGWRKESELNYRIYDCWKHMLERCYSKKYQEKFPTYKGCYVCERWLRLSNFVEDISKIDNYELWINNPKKYIALDKDIKNNGNNKCYCLEQCMFVTNEKNVKQSNKTMDYNKIKKRIIQYDKNMNIIKIWDGIREASRELNLDSSAITKCCKGKQKTVKGFIFKYLKGGE